MKRPIETWRGLDPDTVSKCSPAHIHNLVADAKADLLELHDAVSLARHHINNALQPLLVAAKDGERHVGEYRAHEESVMLDISKADLVACVERIRDAMVALAKVAS